MKDNDSSKTIHFSFVINAYENPDLIQKIRNYRSLNYDSQSDLLRDAVLQFFSNDTQNNIDQKIKIQKLRRETAKAEIEEIESKEFKKYYENFGSLPSNDAKHVIHKKATKTKKIVQPDGSFRCPRCSQRIAESEIYKQVDKLYNHMRFDHNSDYTDEERQEILSVIEK